MPHVSGEPCGGLGAHARFVIDPSSEPCPRHTLQGSADSSRAAAPRSSSNGPVPTTAGQRVKHGVGGSDVSFLRKRRVVVCRGQCLAALKELRRRVQGPGREVAPPTKCLHTRVLVLPRTRTSAGRRRDIWRAGLACTAPGSTGDTWRSRPFWQTDYPCQEM